MTIHVKTKVISCLYSLCQIRSIRRSLTKEANQMLVSNFICSWIDYCYLVFAGLPRSITSNLDSVLSTWCSSHVSSHRRYDHITPVLWDELHWLPVSQWMLYTSCLTTNKAINSTAPSYLAAMCMPTSTNQTCLCLALPTLVIFLYVRKLNSESKHLRTLDLVLGMTCQCQFNQRRPCADLNLC